MLPIPFPVLVHDRQVYLLRAHRMRSAAIADLVRKVARLVSSAAR